MERRAAEPILPPALFRNRVFVVTSAVGFVVGFALFGALTYLPLFQQTVRGLSPTASGLQLLPVMGGLLITSIVSRPGHHAHRAATRCSRSPAPRSPRIGMWLLSSLDETTSTGVAALHMLVLGLGLGMVMQVLVLVVQNAVPYDMLGVATSGATLFRSIGGSLGTAVLGAIFTGRLTAAELSAGSGDTRCAPGAIDRLPALHDPTSRRSPTRCTSSSWSRRVVVLAFVLSWLIEERPLRTTVETTGVGEAIGGAGRHRLAARAHARAEPRPAGRERTLAFLSRGRRARASTSRPAPHGCCCALGAPDAADGSPSCRALPHVDARDA